MPDSKKTKNIFKNILLKKNRDLLIAKILNLFNISPDFNYSRRKRDPKKLTEWMIEGELSLTTNDIDRHIWFSWTQIDTDSQFDLRAESIIGPVLATIKIKSDCPPETVFHTDNQQAYRKITDILKNHQLYPSLAYWLKGLKTSDSACISEQKEGYILSMQEKGWHINFNEYSEFDNYALPRKIHLKSNTEEIRIDVIRAETGFIKNWCKFKTAETLNHTEQNENVAPQIDKWVPQWINSEKFCAQLAKVHNGVHDPKHGIFGPNSVMWEVNRFIAPPGIGSGRALLLQIAHPWITAGIDEHSDVRNDPLERGRRTFLHMYTMIFGSLPQTMKAANQVHQIHKRIKGKIPYDAGRFVRESEYRASEINAMIWVQSTLWDTLIRMYEKIEGKLTDEKKERFYQESKLFAMLFGLPEEVLPETWKDFTRYCENMWEGDTLFVTDATKALSDELFRLRNPVFFIGIPVLKIITACHLPPRLQEAYNLKVSPATRFLNSVFIFLFRILNRILPSGIRYNILYQEAHERINGRGNGLLTRTMLKLVTGKPTLVN